MDRKIWGLSKENIVLENSRSGKNLSYVILNYALVAPAYYPYIPVESLRALSVEMFLHQHLYKGDCLVAQPPNS